MRKYLILGIVILVLIAGGLYIFFFGLNQNSTRTTLQSKISENNQSSFSSASDTSKKNIVTITATGFSPASLTIHSGEIVTWVNTSGDEAMIYSDPNPTHTNYPPLNLGTIPIQGLHTLEFSTAGIYGYYNGFNPGEHGTIIVK